MHVRCSRRIVKAGTLTTHGAKFTTQESAHSATSSCSVARVMKGVARRHSRYLFVFGGVGCVGVSEVVGVFVCVCGSYADGRTTSHCAMPCNTYIYLYTERSMPQRIYTGTHHLTTGFSCCGAAPASPPPCAPPFILPLL